MLVLLLAVNLDQELGQIAQRLDRHQLAVQVGARAAVRADHPSHDQLAVVLHRLLLEPAQRPLGQPREAGGDLGALGAVAHHVPGRAPAGDQQERIDHDGFAGTGLAGERGEAGAELELRLIDDHQVAQLKMGEHGNVRARVSRRRCRDRRLPSAAWNAAGGSNRSRADAAA